MTFPTVIRSQVDPVAVTKVTRLFNNTIGDVLAELIQNARRAGASRVELRVTEAEGVRLLSVSDDGQGIKDPTVVLALGRSGWDDTVAQREDPAGMGVFSLAGRRVVIRSCSRTTGIGWQIDIAPDAWESGTPIPVEPSTGAYGTEIIISLDEAWAAALDQSARYAARHAPICVLLNGERLKQEDWLAGARGLVEEDGVRIGIFDDHRANQHSASINFHGVTVAGKLPSITDGDTTWCVRVDIVNAPDVQLVLPARKEMVENEALQRLRRAARRAVYRHLAGLKGHRLSFRDWREAAELGVALPEARAELRAWTPATADLHTGITSQTLNTTADLLLVDRFGISLEQCAHAALSRDGRFEGRLASHDDKMEGYTWYDRLPRITDMAFEIQRDGETATFHDTELPGLESGLVDRLDLKLTVSGSPPETLSIPAPVMIEYDDSHHWSIEDAAIVFTSPESVTASELVALLEGACFSSSDERDADSWETQHDRFLLDAREIATRILMGDDAALLERLRAVLAYRVQWFAPEGRKLYAIIGRDTLELDIDPVVPIEVWQP